MTNLAEKYWGHYFKKNQGFLDEDQIVDDLIKKIRNSRKSLTWWNVVDKIDLALFSKKNSKLIADFYSINEHNPHFSEGEIRLQETQLRILTRVWEVLNQGKN